jgi:NADP-dependent 3-hydroxy acid dehydrogenase YdfG
MQSRLAGKVVLITGASAGIGKHSLELFYIQEQRVQENLPSMAAILS